MVKLRTTFASLKANLEESAAIDPNNFVSFSTDNLRKICMTHDCTFVGYRVPLDFDPSLLG